MFLVEDTMKMCHVLALGMVSVFFVVAAQPAHAATPGKALRMPSGILADGSVPEPTSLALLAVGSAALLFRRRRR